MKKKLTLFNFFQLQVAAFFGYDLLSMFRGTGVVFTSSILQFFIALLIGIFMRFTFTQRQNLIILAGIFAWHLLPFFLNQATWVIWFSFLINSAAGFAIGLYFTPKKMPLHLLILICCAASSIYLGKYYFQKITMEKYTTLYSPADSTRLLQRANPASYKLTTKKGEPVSIEKFSNKVVLFDFWFIGCKPCEIKDVALQLLAKNYAADTNLLIVKVVPGDINHFEEFAAYKEKAAENTYSLYDSAGILTKKLQADGYPQEYIVNKKGNLVSTYSGYAADMDDAYIKVTQKRIDSLLKL